MFYRFNHFLVLRARARSALGVLLVGLLLAYGVFGDELFSKLSDALGQASRHLAGWVLDFQHQQAQSRLQQNAKSFDELLECRESLAGQLEAVKKQRAMLAARQRDETACLRVLLAILSKNAAPGKESLRAEADKDAAAIFLRVQAGDVELQECDAILQRLASELGHLDREVYRAGQSLELQSKRLERQKADLHCKRAYQDAISLVHRLEP